MSIIIGGVEPFTTVDFPDRLAAVLFCLGCPLRCPYCHNPELQDFRGTPFISWDTFIEFLESRTKLLDGIVFSGGEPLSQKDLYEAMTAVKDRGFDIGLHTSGVNPERLKQVLPLIDWVGFDVKTPFEFYAERIPHSDGNTVKECLDILLKAGTDVEARTTLDPRVISKEELRGLAHTLSDMGVKTYALQEYRPHPSEQNPPSQAEVTAFFTDSELQREIGDLFEKFIVRRA